MSVDRGRPEVSAIRSNRRDQPITDIGWLRASSATAVARMSGAIRGITANENAGIPDVAALIQATLAKRFSADDF